MAHPFGPGQRGAAGRPVDRALARATGRDDRRRQSQGETVSKRHRQDPQQGCGSRGGWRLHHIHVLSQAPTAAAPTGSPAGARARQTTAVPGPLGQVAVFAHQARIAAQHLGHTSRHHLKAVVVEVVVKGHVEKQGVVGIEESRPRTCSALPLISVQPAAQESHRRRRPALQRC
jgi:hypothetical protein